MVVHNLTGWSWKKRSAHVACSIQKGKFVTMISCGPSNFEGCGLHLNLLKKTQMFWINPFVIHYHIMEKLPTF